MKDYPLYEHPQVGTIKEFLYVCEEMYGSRTCFVYQRGQEEVTISYQQFCCEVESLGVRLWQQGLRKSKIAVFGENRYEWILAYFAITCGGNIAVPMDKELDAETIAELLRDSQCKVIIYSDTYADIVERLKQCMDTDICCISMSDIREENSRKQDDFEIWKQKYREEKVEKDALAAIVYTSGTTGKSKGVMLTHGNMISDMYAASQYATIAGLSILVLPLHHMFGLVAGVFAVMFYGCPLYINQSLRRLLTDFQRYKPQNLFVVPLIVETLYKNIWSTAKKQGKDRMLRVMMKVSDILRLCRIDLRKVFFKSVRAALGEKLEVIICGGAPIDVKYIKELESLGITVLNGYGITECAPIVAVNRNRCNYTGSVGRPLLCNEVAIAGDGEILVRGTNVMQGYYHNPEENADVFVDGWFKTGDIGYLGKHGELYITGQKKNLIILSNGENIAAEAIEKEVYALPYVKEAVAYGEAGKVVVEVYLDDAYPDSTTLIQQDIRRINKKLPLARNIGNIKLRDTEFPKTTTKKIKRERCENK